MFEPIVHDDLDGKATRLHEGGVKKTISTISNGLTRPFDPRRRASVAAAHPSRARLTKKAPKRGRPVSQGESIQKVSIEAF
jgi:hypothetical protein